MKNGSKSSVDRPWYDDMGLDTAAQSVRTGTHWILQRASRMGEQLTDRLAAAPLFIYEGARPSRVKQMGESWSKRFTIRSIMRLVVQRKLVKDTLQEIPSRMQLVTNQVRLVIELIDDFADGSYRDIPWHSMAMAAGAILYSVNPTDIVPDVLPVIGRIDDVFLLGIVLRFVERDLCAYATWKGYDVKDYFRDAKAREIAAHDAPDTPAASDERTPVAP